jgi:hypothetical protein
VKSMDSSVMGEQNEEHLSESRQEKKKTGCTQESLVMR